MVSDNTERVGVNAIESIFLNDFKWKWREQTVSDYGIDAIVEVTKDDEPTGKLLALQIKTGASYFKKRRGNYVYNGDMRHLHYWTSHSLPIFIILYNPDEKLAVWQKVERRLAKTHEKGWSIEIPITQVLNNAARKSLENGIAGDEASERRFRFSVDLDTMRLFAEQDTVLFVFDRWINKSLSIRGIKVYFDDYDKAEPDLTYDWWAAHYSIYEFMQKVFPWLTYEYATEVEEHAGEVETHVLEVKLCKEAVMFMNLEEFYESGPDYADPSEIEYEDPYAEDEDDVAMRRAMARDPY